MKKILVVEDDQLLSQLYSATLIKAGFEVEMAYDGATGFDKISKNQYSLILMDVIMPGGIDGLTVLDKLSNSNPKIEHAPIVIMTNLANKVVEDKALSLGAVACLDKTRFTQEELVSKINELTNGKSSDN